MARARKARATTKKKRAPAPRRAPRRSMPVFGAIAGTIASAPQSALAAMIGYWRDRKLPRLADAIDRLDARLPRPAIDKDDQGAWLAAAKNAELHELGAALATFDGGTLDHKTARVRALARRDPDPRIASALFRIVRETPFTSNGSRPTWIAIFDLLGELADPRTLDGADAARAGWTIRENQREWLDVRLNALVETLRDAIPAPVVETADERAALDTIDAALGAGSPAAAPKTGRAGDVDAMLAAIYADPDDDSVRSVYADALMERGDPRGEFIALQLQPSPDDAATKRITALLKKHQREWLGPLAPVINKTGIEFRRGFLSGCTARFKHERDVRALGSHPAWATVETLDHSPSISGDQRRWSMWIDPAMTSLRRLRIFEDNLDMLLDAPAPWKIEHLISTVRDTVRHERLGATDKLPRLTRLQASDLPRGWLARTPLARQLRRLDADRYSGPELFALLDEAAALDTLEQVAAYGDYWSFRRGPARRFSAFRIAPKRRVVDSVRRAIEQLPDDLITAIAIDVSRVARAELARVTADDLEQIAAAANRHRALATLDLTPLGGTLIEYQPAVVLGAPRPGAVLEPEPLLTEIEELAWCGNVMIARAGTRLVRVAVATREAQSLGHVSDADGMALSPDGRTIAVACGGAIQLVDVASGAQGSTLAGHAPRDIMSLAFLATDRLASSGHDKTIRTWNVATGRQLSNVKVSESPRSLGVLPGGTTIASNCGTNSRAAIVTFDGSAKARALGEERVWRIGTSPGGRIAGGGATWGAVHVHDTDGTLICTLKGLGGPELIAFVDENRLVVNFNGDYVAMFELPDVAEKFRIPREGVVATALSPDRTQVALVLEDRIEIWPAVEPAGEPLATIV